MTTLNLEAGANDWVCLFFFDQILNHESMTPSFMGYGGTVLSYTISYLAVLTRDLISLAIWRRSSNVKTP
jgi:hypothetical protein